MQLGKRGASHSGLPFCPTEVDMSIRHGWFCHPEEAPPAQCIFRVTLPEQIAVRYVALAEDIPMASGWSAS